MDPKSQHPTNQSEISENGIPNSDHPLARFAGSFEGENWEGILEEIRLNREKDKAEAALQYPDE